MTEYNRKGQSKDIQLHTLRRISYKTHKKENEQEMPTDGTLEEVFLRAAEKGDIEAVSYALLHQESFDVSCRDKNGDTALQLAVKNSNAEVIKLMLDGGIHPGDSLLRAIDMQNMKTVDIILNFAKSTQGKQYNIINSGMDSDDFHPVVTPLVLAAQNNNHDIIRALLLNGAHLIDDPGVQEDPNECHTVEYSIGILHIYKALSGEFYIALTSKDPIDAAFSICRRLEKLQDREYEFRAEYEELKNQVSNFCCSLLDQLRGSNELETVLTHDLKVWGEDYTTVSDNQLLKLERAIEHKQKAFVAHPNSQLIMTKRWYEGLPIGWRDYSVARDAVGSILIGCSFPIFSVLYLLFPFGWIKKFVHTPHVRFLFETFSYFTFLSLLIISTLYNQDPAPATNFSFTKAEQLEIEQFYDRERGRLPSVTSIVLYIWVIGMTVQESKQIWECGFKKYMKDKWNLIETAQILLYSVWILLKVAAYFEIQREGDIYVANQERCNFFEHGPPCYAAYYTHHEFSICCDPDLSFYGDCLNRQCNDGSTFDGEKCVQRYFNSTTYTWTDVSDATLCADNTAWDGEVCREIPSCYNNYILYGSLFACCLVNLERRVCELNQCVIDGGYYNYNGKDCYLYENGRYVAYGNGTVLKNDSKTCDQSEEYQLAIQTLRLLISDCGGQSVDDGKLKETIDSLLTSEFQSGYLEVTDTIEIRNLSDYTSSSENSYSFNSEEFDFISQYFSSYSFFLSRREWKNDDPNLIAEAAFAIGNICSFLRLLQLITSSRSIGPLEISLERMTSDIARFMVIFIVIWWAFAMGMTQLYYPYASATILKCIEDGGEQTGCFQNPFAGFAEGMETLFWGLVGLGDLGILDTGTDHSITEGVGTLMYAVYIVMAVIILLNVLIAMMSNTFSQIQDNSDIEWKFSRSAIWISYFNKQIALPIPFNILPPPRDIFELCRGILNRAFCHKAEKEMKKKYKDKIKKKNQEYQEVMDNLVARFISDKRSSAFDTDDAVTQTDVIDIRSDVTEFRNEMIELFRNVEGAISNCVDTCDEIFDTVLEFGDSLDVINGSINGKEKSKIVKKREIRNKNVTEFQEKLTSVGLKQAGVQIRPRPTQAYQRRTRIVGHAQLDYVPESDDENDEEDNQSTVPSFFQRIGDLLA